MGLTLDVCMATEIVFVSHLKCIHHYSAMSSCGREFTHKQAKYMAFSIQVLLVLRVKAIVDFSRNVGCTENLIIQIYLFCMYI